MGRPLMVMPARTASSRDRVTSRPWLLAPSPEMSMTRRRAVKPLASNRGWANWSASLIEVRRAVTMGLSARAAEKARASSAPPIRVQSTTMVL
jgi:hypothetical protein